MTNASSPRHFTSTSRIEPLPVPSTDTITEAILDNSAEGDFQVSSLTAAEKVFLEKILDMGGGYVLRFTDPTFEQFFDNYDVTIHSATYRKYGTSKAKKIHAFWEKESDALVGLVLKDLLDAYEAQSISVGQETDSDSLEQCRKIVKRLLGRGPGITFSGDEAFLKEVFQLPDFGDLPVDLKVAEIIQDRLSEAQKCLTAEAHLSVVFLCGSILEAILLGAALKYPEKFNRSTISPKREGKVRPLQEWSLAALINVGQDVGVLKPDVKEFSHGLRDFRNYIHPYQQMASGFAPDKHTADICLQVLKAALADVAGNR